MVLSKQSIRQEARRAALDAQTKRRAQRAEREKRLEDLAVRVLVAIRERDAAIADAEQRAGQALSAMTGEGLSVRDIVAWCGDEMTTRDVYRLRRLASPKTQSNGAGDSADRRAPAGPGDSAIES